jgi:hypothetical protein
MYAAILEEATRTVATSGADANETPSPLLAPSLFLSQHLYARYHIAMQTLAIPASVNKRKQACKSCRQRKKRCDVS